VEFAGRYMFHANRLRVWQALNDAEVLSAVIPGCRRIEWVAPDRLELAVEVNLGVTQPVFTGDLELSDVVPAEKYTLIGRGHGRLLGKATGIAHVRLEARPNLTSDDEKTLLTFTAEGGASGRIVALGKPLIGRSVQKVIDGFFTRLADTTGVSVEVLDPHEEDVGKGHA